MRLSSHLWWWWGWQWQWWQLWGCPPTGRSRRTVGQVWQLSGSEASDLIVVIIIIIVTIIINVNIVIIIINVNIVIIVIIIINVSIVSIVIIVIIIIVLVIVATVTENGTFYPFSTFSCFWPFLVVYAISDSLSLNNECKQLIQYALSAPSQLRKSVLSIEETFNENKSKILNFSQMLSVSLKGAEPPPPPLTVSLTVKYPCFYDFPKYANSNFIWFFQCVLLCQAIDLDNLD